MVGERVEERSDHLRVADDGRPCAESEVCLDDARGAFRTQNILNEFRRECLTSRAKRKLRFMNLIDALTDLLILRGPPAFVRSGNRSEFVDKEVCAWI